VTFEFATAGRILFGAGKAAEVAPAAASLGSRVLLVTGKSGRFRMEAAARLAVSGEPTVELVREGTRQALAAGCDVVVAAGGGSAIDAGKAIAALMGNGGDPLDYLEVIGAGRPLARPSAPFIAVPTTAGTGSEVTRNAVLASTEHRVKASLRSPHMLATLAVVDPDLTMGLPPAITAATGLDALTQLIEPYVSARANSMTDLFALEGIRRVRDALPRACRDEHDARGDMALASLLGGLSLANAGLGAAHGFAAPIGGRFPAPHGAVCAALLPHVMRVNIRAVRERQPERLPRFETVSRILAGSARPEDGAAWVLDLCRRLEIPPLSAYGVTAADTDALVEQAARASSMKANPIVLTRDELHEILSAAL